MNEIIVNYLSFYQEKSESTQSQLELNSRRHKLQKRMNSLDKTDVSTTQMTNGQNSPGKSHIYLCKKLLLFFQGSCVNLPSPIKQLTYIIYYNMI